MSKQLGQYSDIYLLRIVNLLLLYSVSMIIWSTVFVIPGISVFGHPAHDNKETNDCDEEIKTMPSRLADIVHSSNPHCGEREEGGKSQNKVNKAQNPVPSSAP
jgi:hypothetical protein